MNTGPAAVLAEGAFLFAVFFGPLAFGCVEAWAQAILFSILFLAVALAPSAPPPPIQRSFLPGLVVVLAIGIAQTLHAVSIDGPQGFRPFSACVPESGQAVLRWAAYSCLIWVAPGALARRGACQRLAASLLAVGVLVAIIGRHQQLVQGSMIDGHGLVYGFRPVRFGRVPFGPYFNKAHAGSVLAMATGAGIGLCLSQVAALRRLRREFKGSMSDALAKLVVTTFLTLVAFAGLIYSRSRGAQISLLVACVAMIGLAIARIVSPRLRRAVAAGSALVTFCALSLAPLIAERLQGASNSVAIRRGMLQDSLRLAFDFPVWGTGLGTVEGVFRAYSNLGTRFGPRVIVDHVHNDWIELLLQVGIVGFLAYAIGFTVFMAKAVRWWLECPSSEQRGLAAGALIAATSFVAHGLFDFSFQIPANAALFLLLLCWLSAQMERPGRSPRSDAPVTRRAPLRRLSIAAASVFLCASTIPAAISEHYFNRGDYVSAARWVRGPRQLYGLAWTEYEGGAIRRALTAAEDGRRIAPWDSRFELLRASALARIDSGKRGLHRIK